MRMAALVNAIAFTASGWATGWSSRWTRAITGPPSGIADSAQSGQPEPALELVASLRARHLAVAQDVADSDRAVELCEEIDEQFERLGAVVRSLAVLREVAPRSLDAVAAFGEILSSRIVAAALATRGLQAEWIDPRRLILTDNSFTTATPLMPETFARPVTR